MVLLRKLDLEPTKQPSKLRSLPEVLKITIVTKILVRYLRHIPLLILGLILLAVLWWLVTTWYPRELRNVVFAGSYLPIVATSFGTVFCFAAFVLLNSRRGVVVALLVTGILYLELLQMNTFFISSGMIIFGILWEVIATSLKSDATPAG